MSPVREMKRPLRRAVATFVSALAALAVGAISADADEAGISFWVPGTYGALAAAPLPPGFSLAEVYYPAQRYFNLICIAYGAHPEAFKEVVDNHYLPQARAEDCAFEYSALAWAFSHLIEPNIDRELGQKVLDRDWLPVPGQRPKRPPHAP